MDVPVTAAIGFKPFQLVAGFEIHQTVFRTEPVHSDLTGNAAVVCPYHTFRNAVCQKIICDWMQPNAGLQLGDKTEVLSGNHLPVLRCCPFCKSLGGSAVGFACPGIDGTVRNYIVTVKCLAAFEDQAVGCSTNHKCGGVFVLNFASYLLAVESRRFPEVCQKMTGHEFSAAATSVIFARRFIDDEVDVHC